MVAIRLARFGRMCRRITVLPGAPIAIEASTNVRRRSASVSPKMTRAVHAQ
jgi:hypothetical protein